MLRVKVLRSFNGLAKGTTGTVDGTEPVARARAYAAAGLMEVTDDGTDPGGSGGPATGDPGGQPEGAGEHGATGGEPGEDPLPG